ncbi:MAG: molecular chaperone HtpG [Luteibaculaceae bacterium]
MQKGSINVQTENIFPIIKKFLYSDHEIFLREIVSNAVDACSKLKTLTELGEISADASNLRVQVSIDKEAKTITVKDNGIGMTAEEIEKYINQIAFSGAEEFVNKYKDKNPKNAIIGHFGLGFYSSFMVSSKVQIITKSHKEDAPAVIWTCDGSPNYEITETTKTDRGTEIIMHIAEDSEEFLEDSRISGILNKYCKFLPISIQFGTKTVYEDDPSGAKDEKDNVKQIKKEVDNIINNPAPAWTKSPSELKAEDYKSFYSELYPMNFEDPLFHIHLNVDYPFNLTGILYFPKFSQKIDFQKNKIQLYCNQVFVTDNVENIVPDYLALLHGVIDSPDIPLNVSRSYLQEDGNVKKISSHISKKVSDKLHEIFKDDRADFEKKWDDIRLFVEYGMLADEKFQDRTAKFALYKNTESAYFTWDELIEKVKPLQTDKNGNTVLLYTNNQEEQYLPIAEAKEKGYQVLVMDTPLSAHLISMLEQKNEKVQIKRVDAESIEKLIEKDEEIPSKLSAEDEEKLKPVYTSIVEEKKFTVVFESLSETAAPVSITQSEFMRRMKEQQAVGGGGFNMFGTMPEMYNLVVNSNHPVTSKILAESDAEKQKALASQTIDLAMLSAGLLKGEKLNAFVKRSLSLLN